MSLYWVPRFVKYLVTVLIILSCCSTAKVSNLKRTNTKAATRQKDSPEREGDPFEQLAQFLIKSSKKGELEGYSSDEVRRSVKKLATGQETLKSMDGAAHQLRSTFSDSTSSLRGRFEKFISGDKKKLKEAGKLYEYVTTVERSLQAAEILQAVGQPRDGERGRWMKAAGLREVKRIALSSGKVQCVLSVMTPLVEADAGQGEGEGSADQVDRKEGGGDQGEKVSKRKSKRVKAEEELRFSPGELVIGIVDGPAGGDAVRTVQQLLQTMTQPVSYLALNSVGLVKEEVTVQPSLLAMAVEALEGLGEFILPVVSVIPIAAPSEGDGEGEGALSVPTPLSDSRNSTEEGTAPLPAVTARGDVVPRKISILGHSAGGAVGAYAAMVLEGFLNSTETPLMRCTEPFVGTYAGRVHCISLGPPPCVSRAVVPRFVSSVICGDDAVPRASPQSLANTIKRVAKALKAGAGDKMGLRWKVGSGWLSDLQSVAGKGIGQYAGGAHDLTALSVPGRAFYVKNRQRKQGASIQRVLRGQWREDLLWTLHEVLLSKRMLEHHSLEAHIKTLSRC